MPENHTEDTAKIAGLSPEARNRIGVGLLIAAFIFLAGAIFLANYRGDKTLADPGNVEQVARGKTVYTQRCASCHGVRLEGQPNWREKLPNGRMPAPPHDASGHTWHHPDTVLFGIVKHGLVPGKYAPPSYQSDMPAFDRQLSDDEIWAVLAFIKSNWPDEIRDTQEKITRDAAKH